MFILGVSVSQFQYWSKNKGPYHGQQLTLPWKTMDLNHGKQRFIFRNFALQKNEDNRQK